MNIRVFLVDDHQILLAALRTLLEKVPGIEVSGIANEVPMLFKALAETSPDVVVMDLGMPGIGGLEATRRLIAEYPKIKVVVLSGYTDRRYVSEALSAGANGYIVKGAAAEELPRAIRAVVAGQTYLCPQVAADLVATLRTKQQLAPLYQARLGPREISVLQLVAKGQTSREIAAALHIAPSTVDVHRRNIMRKLQLHSVAELTRYAIREGLAEP